MAEAIVLLSEGVVRGFPCPQLFDSNLLVQFLKAQLTHFQLFFEFFDLELGQLKGTIDLVVVQAVSLA